MRLGTARGRMRTWGWGNSVMLHRGEQGRGLATTALLHPTWAASQFYRHHCWLFHFPSPGSTTRSRGRSSPARCIPPSRQPWRNPPPRNILGQCQPPAPAQDPLTAQHPSSFQAAAAPPSSFPSFRGALLKLQPSRGAHQRCASKFRDSTISRGCFRGGEKSFLQTDCSNVPLKMNTQIKIALLTQSIPRQ